MKLFQNIKTFGLVFSFFILSLNSFAQKDTLAIKSIFDQAFNLQTTNLDSAYTLTKLGFVLSQKINYQSGIANAFQGLGNILSIKNKNDSALIYFRLALAIRLKIQDFRAVARTCKSICYLFRERGQKDSAFFYLYKAIKILNSSGDSLLIGTIYNELTELSLNFGAKKDALNFLNEAYQIFNRHNDIANLSFTYSKFGIYYFYDQDYKKAINYFTRSKFLHDSLNNEPYIKAKDCNYLGLCFDELGNSKISLLYYQEALKLFTQIALEYDVAEVQYNIGVNFYHQKKFDSSIVYFEKAKLTIEGKKQGDLFLKIYEALAELYALKGNYIKAYDYHVKYANLNDSLLNKEKVNSITEMQTKYETDKKNQQLTLLDEKIKTQTAERNMLVTGCILLLVLLLASTLYLRQRNKIAKKNEQLAQEKISSIIKEQEIKSYNAMIEGQDEERKRIAIDLHDRIGSILSTVKLLFGALDEKIDKAHEENIKQYNQASNLLDEAVTEVRRISHNLSAGIVTSFGLVAALEELCESIHNSRIIRCKLLYFGLNSRLEPKIEIGIYRMIQEMINNILKHAKAKRITVQLNRTSESINVTVEDDGIGFDVAEKMKSGGMGLKNLEARAAKLNGVYHIDSKPGRGTISIIEIPLTENHD